MCDIWKDNKNSKSLSYKDIQEILVSFRRLNTQWVVMSGGEALMNPRVFEFCQLLKNEKIKITILSTGLLLKKYADKIVRHCDEVIVSLDGSEAIHNQIRRIPNAYGKLLNGISANSYNKCNSLSKK